MNQKYILKMEEQDKIVSHITRVNSISQSSKIIFPKRIIKELGLKWNNDYIEWKVVVRGGQKMAIVQKHKVSH